MGASAPLTVGSQKEEEDEHRAGISRLRGLHEDDPLLRVDRSHRLGGAYGIGYRIYGDSDVHTLRFIRRARDLGFSVEQIEELLALWRDRDRASSGVKQIALDHVAGLERKVEELHQMIATLRHLADHCHGDDRPDCPIIEDLAKDTKREDRPVAAPKFGPAKVSSTKAPARAARGAAQRLPTST